MAAFLELLGGELQRRGKAVRTEDALSGKSRVLLYFSDRLSFQNAAWLQELAAAYAQATRQDGSTEMVFVGSGEEGEHTFNEVIGESPFLVLPAHRQDVALRLAEDYTDFARPVLAVFDANGTLRERGVSASRATEFFGGGVGKSKRAPEADSAAGWEVASSGSSDSPTLSDSPTSSPQLRLLVKPATLNSIKEVESNRGKGDELEEEITESTTCDGDGNAFDKVLLLGEWLLIGEESQRTKDVIRDAEYVMLLFGAARSVECVDFIQKELAPRYEAQGADKRSVVIYVSCDSSETVFDALFATMPFYAVPHARAKEMSSQLCERFGVRSVPALVVLDSAGSMVDSDGARALDQYFGSEVGGNKCCCTIS